MAPVRALQNPTLAMRAVDGHRRCGNIVLESYLGRKVGESLPV